MNSLSIHTCIAMLAASALLSTGCGPTPDSVCAKLKELSAEPSGCSVKWSVKKSRDPEGYKREAECVLAATTNEAAVACLKK